ncbi:MAG: cell envelope integrity protein CreD, partial [Dokdonella sp.]
MNLPNGIHGATFKVLGIGLLALLMFIPLAQVRELVSERASREEAAKAAIASRWGDEQMLGGPVLVIPVHYRVEQDKGWRTVEVREFVLPDRLNVSGTLEPEIRQYGIYETPVYVARLHLEGDFLPKDIAALGCTGCEPQWDQAQLRVPISDVRGLREISPIRFNGTDVRLGPDDGGVAGIAAVSAAVIVEQGASTPLAFAFDMTLAGTARIAMLPLARQTQAKLGANWPDPGFDGAFLPVSRTVNDKGFEAQWQVLDVNRRIPQHWRENDGNSNINPAAASFGVSLVQVTNPYQRNERAGKYGVLFIGLTFVAFFLFEVLRCLRVHPVQYLLVGLALCTFYVVLLALSEQVGFGFAYL